MLTCGRPPPPFQYTCTLPPPAPKKQRSKSSEYRSKTLPAPSRRSSSQQPSPGQGDSGKCPEIKQNNCDPLTTITDNISSAQHVTEHAEDSCQISAGDTIFFASFRKATQDSPVSNTLCTIGEKTTANGKVDLALVSANGVKNMQGKSGNDWIDDECVKKIEVTEEKRKRKKEEFDNSSNELVSDRTSSSCSPPSKRSSIENFKSMTNVSSDESTKTKIGSISVTNCCLKQKQCGDEDRTDSTDMSTCSPQQQMKNSKYLIAPESLASRAKHESQEQLRKFKKNVSPDECKTKSSILHTRQNCHELRQSTGSTQRGSTSSSSSSSSVQRGGQDKKILKNIEEQPARMSPVLAIKNIMKKSDKNSKRKKNSSDKTPGKISSKKECPLVLEDKYSRVLIKGGQHSHSPTPSLASSTSTDTSRTLTDRSSYAPSNLSLLSDLLSEKDYQMWLTPALGEGKNNFKGIEDLDRYVFDMMAFTQDIQSPRASQISKSKKANRDFDDLIKILNHKKRQSTNLEMKKSLQIIIDFVGEKKQSCAISKCTKNSIEKVIKFGVENTASELIMEESEDYFMDCPNEEQRAKIRFQENKQNLCHLDTNTIPMISVAAPPVPSPRLKRKNRIDGSSPTPSSISTSSRLLRSDSKLSVSSLNSLIHELHQQTPPVEDRHTVSGSCASLETKV